MFLNGLLFGIGLFVGIAIVTLAIAALVVLWETVVLRRQKRGEKDPAPELFDKPEMGASRHSGVLTTIRVADWARKSGEARDRGKTYLR